MPDLLPLQISFDSVGFSPFERVFAMGSRSKLEDRFKRRCCWRRGGVVLRLPSNARPMLAKVWRLKFFLFLLAGQSCCWRSGLRSPWMLQWLVVMLPDAVDSVGTLLCSWGPLLTRRLLLELIDMRKVAVLLQIKARDRKLVHLAFKKSGPTKILQAFSSQKHRTRIEESNSKG